jgi:hypothetical protein
VPKQREWVTQGPSYQLASASLQVVVGVRGDREDRYPAKAAEAPRVVLASVGPIAIGLPARAATADEAEAETTASIPNPAAPEVVTPKAVPAKLASPPVLPPKLAPPAKPRDAMEDVDSYLWQVYEREPLKKDSTGDFTWKDRAAAKHLGKSLKAYVIGGMDPDFREQLYHAGRAMDAAGLRWSMLSAFRDDYRQQIAAGFKARTGNSLHGGSRATGGYGHGRAIDVTSVGGHADEAVWHWLDRNGAKYGLIRPMPGADPAHIRPRGDWHKIAVALRRARAGTTNVAAAPEEKAKVADEQRRHHRRGGRG